MYAYLRSSDPPRQHAFSALYIPLLNIPAADLGLRPEFTELFRHADIGAQDLLTLDDLPSLETIEQIWRPEATRWILVDHNKLQGVLGSVYSSRVHGVIDHHDDEGSVPQVSDPEPRVIEKCGSCTSLVIRTLRSSWDAISLGRSPSSPSSPAQSQAKNSSNETSKAINLWDAQLAKTALASILIDTANLTAEGKVETADIEAVQYLEFKILSSTMDDTAAIWDRREFYDDLHTAKQNIDSLTLNDILRKDYKQWPSKSSPSTILGISSVVKPLSFLAAKAAQESPQAENAFDHTIQTFMQSRHLSLFAIMTTFSAPSTGRARELLLQTSSSSPSSPSPSLSSNTPASDAASHFATQSRAELGLEPLHISGIENTNNSDNNDDNDDGDSKKEKGWSRYVWTQKEVNKSRKQVAPLLREVLG